jgi:hypothetical protein
MALSHVGEQLLLVGVPGIMTLVGSITLIHRFLTGRRGIWMQGTVTGIVVGRDSDGALYRSRIIFGDVDDQPTEVLDEFSFNYKAHHIGQKLWVGYCPEEPNRVRVWRIWPSLASAAVLVAGVFVLWLGMNRLNG